MARYIGPKHRLCRREGVSICGSEKCPVLKKGAVPPGMHGQKRRRKASDYALELREKQKTKRIYGVLEKQFRRYVNIAQRKLGATGEMLLQLLETRLDNVVYRLGFAPTRRMARQLVNHGHVFVNNKRVDIASYNVKPDEVITLSPKAIEIPTVKKLLQDKDIVVPSWLEKKAAAGRILKIPARDQIDTDISEQLIVEFYSR